MHEDLRDEPWEIIAPLLPPPKRTGRPPKMYPVRTCRWKVEPTYGWLDNWRRLVVRYDGQADVCIAFLTVACFMTTLSKILG